MDLCETLQKQFASGLVPTQETLQEEQKFEREIYKRLNGLPVGWRGCSGPGCGGAIGTSPRETPGNLGRGGSPPLAFSVMVVTVAGRIRCVPWGDKRRQGGRSWH